MIAYELLHSLNKLEKCNNEKMAVKLDMLKLDMSQAYDQVE